jgi:hypothetical protein
MGLKPVNGGRKEVVREFVVGVLAACVAAGLLLLFLGFLFPSY